MEGEVAWSEPGDEYTLIFYKLDFVTPDVPIFEFLQRFKRNYQSFNIDLTFPLALICF